METKRIDNMHISKELLIGMFVLVLAVGGLGAYAIISLKVPLAVGNVGPTSTLPGSTATQYSCPPQSTAPTLVWYASNVTPVTGGTSYVATPSNITSSTNNNNQTVISNTKLTSSGVSFTSSQCGAVYTSIVGDNLNWYQNKTTAISQAGVSLSVVAQTFQYSALAGLAVANTPQATPTGNSIVNAIGTGGLVSQYQVQLQAGRGWFGFPNEGFVVAFPYNNLAITSISIPGAATYTGGSLPISYVLGQNAQADFIFQAVHFSQYASPSGSSSGYTTFSPIIQTSSGFSGTTQISFVGIAVLPLTNYMDVQGHWHTGAAVFGVPGINAGQSAGGAIAPMTTNSYFLQLTHS